MLRSLFRTFEPYIATERICGNDRFDFWITDEVAKSWYDTTPDQTLPEKLWCRDHIKPGMRVVDCGAHHGMMSVLFSKWTGLSGRVTAYEVMPSNRAVVAQNLELNSCTNVTVRPYGLGARPGLGMFAKNKGNAVRSVRTRAFEITSLDADIEHVDFVKIDVEGSELEALRGSRRVISQCRPIICLELHCFLFKDRAAVLEEIAALLEGYSFDVLDNILGQPHKLSDLRDLAHLENPHLFCIPCQ